MAGDANYNNVSLLLHCNGANGSTTFTDNSPRPKTITPVGNVKISTAQSKYGGASGLFDGSGDILTFPSHADFNLGSGNWTIECWVRFSNIANAADAILQLGASGTERPVNLYRSGLNLILSLSTGGTNITNFSTNTSPITAGGLVWQHIAAVRSSNTISIYVDGVVTNVANAAYSSTLANPTANRIGDFTYVGDPYDLEGNLEEFRITKGIARYTANFTPPTAAFADYLSNDNSGIIAGTLDDLTGSIIAAVVPQGVIAGTLDDLTGLFNGNFILPVSGEIAGTFDDLTGTLTAAVIPQGVLSGTLDDLTGSMTGLFTQIITLPIEQTIAYAAGDISLLFTQSITQSGDVDLAFEQRIFNPVSLIYVDWTVEINVGGVDISPDLTGQVRIEAARSAARIAEFTVILSGAVDVLAWAGKSVAIDYIQGDGARWRRFTGVIETPAVDIDTGTLHCTCTDELQRIIDGQSKTQLDKLVPARWSPHVFNADRTGWDYLQDLLSTARLSVERESNGVIKATPWQAKAAADYIYTDAQVLDNPGIAIDLPSRMDMINRVDIELQASSENRYHQTQRLSWSIGSFCNFAQNSLWPPAKSMVKEAIESAGWKMISADYTPLWPSGVYDCSGQTIVFANQDPEAIIGFSARAAYRWSQNDDYTYKISVKSNASIAAYGELAETISAHAQFDPAQDDWGGDDDDYSVFPDNTIQTQPGRLLSSTLDTDELTETIDTLIAQAVAKIENSHRRNIIRYDLPLAPYLELSHTLALDLADVSARGPVQELVETYDLSSGQAITSVTLALSSGQSGLINTPAPRPFSQITAPEPDPAPGVAIHSRSFVTYVGGLAASPPEDENWSGYLVNAKPEAPGSETYAKGFRIVFDAIEEVDTANKISESTYTVAVNVPHDPLIMTV